MTATTKTPHPGSHRQDDANRPSPPLRGGRVKAALVAQARAHGFDAVGVTRPDAAPEAKARLERFLAEGAHGDMVWMATTAERRASPAALWPEVRSVVMLGMNYGPDDDPLAILKRRDRGAISSYAKGDDYHELIKARLKQLARWLTEHAGGDVKVFVDTAAVMEKPLAGAAGLGWQGKHTNLVSRAIRLVAVSRLDLHHARVAGGRSGRRLLRHLPRLPRHLPDRGVSRAVPARCAALHFVSHHRAQGPDPARIPRRNRQPHLRLRRLPRRLPVEQICGRGARGQACGTRDLARAGAGRTGAARRRAIP